MTRRTLSTVAILASLAGPATAQNRPQTPPTGQPSAAPAQTPPRTAQEEPKPYRKIITAQTISSLACF